LIHSLHFKDSNTFSTFWQLQSTIVAQLQSLRNLQMVVAIIIPDHDRCCVKKITQHLKSAGWYISKFNNQSFPSISATIAGCCDLVIGVHSSCASCIELLELKMPPPVSPHPLGAFIWEPFSRPEYSVSLVHDNNDFCYQDEKL
jgi:hypothetical protein